MATAIEIDALSKVYHTARDEPIPVITDLNLSVPDSYVSRFF